ncbi:MAG: methionyl-tRNA formyltransferase [Alphaproteobacteria bacterium]|nr:methionyl-tRNA formyltransferase [Alphaproteobacteria bacterium]
MGTPDFAVPALRALADRGHDIVSVYTQPPRPAGRGQHEQPSPVHRFAAERGYPVRTPRSLAGDAEQAEFAALGADFCVVAAYGLMLPPSILSAPRFGCLNIHASLLPRWRGASPIQSAILAGDSETGVTIMQMDAGLDTGPILLQEQTPITEASTGASLHDELAQIGARAILAAIDGLLARKLVPQPQSDAAATHCRKLTRADGRLDWSQPAADLERRVRAFTPWPGAWFDLGGEPIRVLESEVMDDIGDEAAGTVLPGAGMAVRCGDRRALRLRVVQRPGKRPLADKEFRRGWRRRPSPSPR